ncbi:MAG: siderophore-interacting protein [Actinomycetota bacterium]|nr:siderophore-interacting protein [Actinomycetota bacterium]
MAPTPRARRPNGEQAPPYRIYLVEVARSERLGPSFVRVTFTGECLQAFRAAGVDQRIKLLLPQPGRTVVDIPSGPGWYPAWQAMPQEIRPTMRTYTVRAHRPKVGELDIDFVLHGADGNHGGPASAWASKAHPGDVAALAAPDRPGSGRMWGCEWSPPETARRLIIAGDETAVPAVASIVESLPPQARGVVCAEVPTVGDRQYWDVPDGIEVRWLVRQDATGSAPHGSLLEAAVAEVLTELCGPNPPAAGTDLEDVDLDTSSVWDVPEGPTGELDAPGGELYAWLAGEAMMIKRLRRLMVNDHGVARTAVAFMGYWRQGRSG